MRRLLFRTDSCEEAGFALVEVLLASAIFAMMVAGIIGAFVYGRESTYNTGDRLRAMELADEGVQAVRNIRDASFSNLTAGTYGLAQSSGTWALSGSSDTTGIYTRQIAITSGGTNRFNVTATVTWPEATGITGSVSDTTELSNWMATIHTPSWNTPTLQGSTAFSGYKVATQGNYAYVIKNSSGVTNFEVVNTTTPASPTLVGSLTLAGTPTNIAVSGNYAYVSNASSSSELQIINIATPTAPSLTSTYNAPGSAGGLGVYVVGNYVYLSRAANGGNDELVIVNVTTPTAPTLLWGWSDNVNLNEVYVNGTTIYLATSSSTQQVIGLTGTAAATTITGSGSTLYVGQGTTFYAINGGLVGLLMSVYSKITLPGTINDLTTNTNGTYVYAGTNYATGQLQVVNISVLTGITIAGSAAETGSVTINGVSYNSTENIVTGVSTSSTQGVADFGPN